VTLHPMEEATVRAFVLSAKRDRWLSLLGNPKRRATVLRELSHGSRFFDPRFATAVPSNRDAGEMLRALGAPALCRVISEHREFDGRELPIVDVVREAVGFEIGVLICCLPGTLACSIGEVSEPRLILSRPAPLKPAHRPQS
jgi:hypothetical protein